MAQADFQGLSQAQAQTEILAHVWTLDNNGMLGLDPYAGTLGPIWYKNTMLTM
ncbi:hypothetical protein HanXRQr2_Chr16g0750011 [Helianthus annuus]|uniref:Uncharacterized protein n=1 Tax=Helianthus annuus TaxID=4232 RepID=A0A251RYY3_HELAN|nr:hypothetical protein HanXRQr2_Chr16g0749891 [Helianthus annuus]KAF5760155.1 hypothetical protein HanXRQr2_Chr16g0750011 [Helianthus annuus]